MFENCTQGAKEKCICEKVTTKETKVNIRKYLL